MDFFSVLENAVSAPQPTAVLGGLVPHCCPVRCSWNYSKRYYFFSPPNHQHRLCLVLSSSPPQGAASELQKVIDQYIKFANSSDEAYAHIEAEVRRSTCLLALLFSPCFVCVCISFYYCCAPPSAMVCMYRRCGASSDTHTSLRTVVRTFRIF